MTEKVKRTAKVDDWTTLKGKFFHDFDDDGYVKHQGVIIDFINEEIAIVQYYEWFVGSSSTIQAVWLSDIVDGGWALYSSDEAMRDAYDIGSVPRRPEKPNP